MKALGGHFYELCFGKRSADELYDLKRDPECVNNLAADLAFTPTLEEMRYTMMRLLKEDGDPRALGKGDDFEALKYVGGRTKGYETWLKEQESGVLAELKKKLDEQPAKGGKKKKGAPQEN